MSQLMSIFCMSRLKHNSKSHFFLLRLAIDPQYTKWVPRWLLLFKMFPSYTKQIAMHDLDWYAVSSHSLHTLTRFLTKLTAMQ